MKTIVKDDLLFSEDGNEVLGSNTELLESLVIPEGTKEIASDAFAKMQITSLTIPDSMDSISKNAFCSCRYLNDIDFGNGCKKIGESAFSCCRGLYDIVFPQQIRIVDKEAFCDCENLENLELNDGLSIIMQDAFNHCYSLSEIALPSSLRCLGDRSLPWAKKITVNGSDLPHNLLRGITFLSWNNRGNCEQKKMPLTIEVIFGEKHIFIPRFVDMQKVSDAECALNSGMDEYLQTMYKYGTDGTVSAETAHAMYMYLLHTHQEPCEELKKYVKRISRNIATRLIDLGKYEELSEFIRLNLLTTASLKKLRDYTNKPEIRAYLLEALEKTKKKTSM